MVSANPDFVADEFVHKVIEYELAVLTSEMGGGEEPVLAADLDRGELGEAPPFGELPACSANASGQKNET